MAWWEAGLRLLLAVVVGCSIGIERERKNRPAGMRTHVLVCVGAALIAVIESMNVAFTQSVNLASPESGVAVSMGRMSAQVISGVGFLGAGTIFVAQKKIAGLTTAASLWCTACLGLAAGMGYYGLAAAGGALVIVTLTLMQRVVHVNQIKHLEVKFIRRAATLAFINAYFEEMGVKVLDVDFHVENKGKDKVYTNLYTIDLPAKTAYKDIVIRLSEYENIEGIRTRNV
ncbi:MAG: MgtC/SapB family protein [Clostridia bacterium]|nr:MgtC/SapB family protein [Clostridia bacterium]